MAGSVFLFVFIEIIFSIINAIQGIVICAFVVVLVLIMTDYSKYDGG
ncbi:hypothetical protein KJ708_06790 [bacterium]|nr:hypothetical protein [bacterium]MBU1916874.1 hypothetical protein [bacterium]